jgi:hypothetical protein
MGRLGRERTFFVCDRRQDVKIPTDLLGVNPAVYTRRKGQPLGKALADLCSSIAKTMAELHVRLKRTPEMEIEDKLSTAFCERLIGTWWGRQWSQDGVLLSFLQIAWEYGANVQLEGDSFDVNGEKVGTWSSVAIGLQVNKRTLFYSWEGQHPDSPGETFQGFGQYTFNDAPGTYDRGEGLFSTLHIGRKKAVVWKSVELRRVDMADLDRVADVMKNGNDIDRAAEVLRALARFKGPDG